MRIPRCREVSVTTANVNDGKASPEALPDNPDEVFADSAYCGNHFCDAVRAREGIPRIVATGMWGVTKPKRCVSFTTGINRSITCGAGSGSYSERGIAATG